MKMAHRFVQIISLWLKDGLDKSIRLRWTAAAIGKIK